MRVNLASEFSLPQDILKTSQRPEKSFHEHIKSYEMVYLKEQLEGELAAIEEQGRLLYQRRTLEDLRKYRQMVADFIRNCISQGLNLKQERHTTNFGRTKILSVLKTIDDKILSLAEQLIEENGDPLKILALVDEIRGLLLDLYT